MSAAPVFPERSDNRSVYLQVVAIGERHPKSQRRLSVYQIAHRRLWQD